MTFQRFARPLGLSLLLMVAAPLGALPLGGCKTGVRGSGNTRTEKREIGEFTEVKVSAGLEADVDVGVKAPLEVSGDDNLISMVKTTIEGSTLVISLDGAVQTTVPLTVHVVTPKISALETSSGAKIRASSISIDNLKLTASSGSHLSATGKCTKLTASATSGSEVDGARLDCTSAVVEASSGASIDVLASDTVDGKASSGAKVMVEGHPHQNTIKSSSGGTVSAN